MDRMPLPPEIFFEGTPPHVRAYIEQLHATITNLHKRIAELYRAWVRLAELPYDKRVATA